MLSLPEETQLELIFTRNVLAAEEPLRFTGLSVHVCLSDGAVFRCPAAMLCAGSKVLADLLEGAKREETVAGTTELSLPSVDSEVFQTIALYFEHFYGSAVERDSLHGVSRSCSPTPLSRPVQTQELYNLSDWEHAFVVQQLLMWPQDSWSFCKDGKWVDVSWALTSDVHFADLRLSLQRILGVLEAATTFDVTSLRDLCGAVIANVFLDLDEKRIFELIGVSETFDPEDERTLLREYPWLKF